MTKQIFVLEWDEEDLGEGWMNIWNLELCLYSKEHTRRDLLKVTELKDAEIVSGTLSVTRDDTDHGGHA